MAQIARLHKQHSSSNMGTTLSTTSTPPRASADQTSGDHVCSLVQFVLQLNGVPVFAPGLLTGSCGLFVVFKIGRTRVARWMMSSPRSPMVIYLDYLSLLWQLICEDCYGCIFHVVFVY